MHRGWFPDVDRLSCDHKTSKSSGETYNLSKQLPASISPSLCPYPRLPTARLKTTTLSPTTSVAPVQVHVNFHDSSLPMGIDGASSFVETQSPNPSLNVQAYAYISHLTYVGQSDTIASNLQEHSPSNKEASLKRPTDHNLKNVVGHSCHSSSSPYQTRKKRLPWLDGSQSRHGSMPPVPGAFLDDSSTPKLADTSRPAAHCEHASGKNYTAREAETAQWASTPSRTQQLSNQPSIQSPQQVTPPPPPGSQAVSNLPSPVQDTNYQSPSKAPEDKTSILFSSEASPSSQSQSIPMLEMARKLYQTDSSALSDSDASMKGDRKRALADSVATAKAEKMLPPIQTRYELRDEQDQLSPKAQTDQNSKPTLESTQDPAPLISASRKLSMTVQPVRQSKVTGTPDDVAAGQRARQRSIAVQPIKIRSVSSLQSVKEVDEHKDSMVQENIIATKPAEDIGNSIAGLETLMQEAMSLARHAAKHNRSDEVPQILNEARFALQRSSIVQSNQQTAVAGKLFLDRCPSDSSGTSDCPSCTSESTAIPTKDFENPSLISLPAESRNSPRQQDIKRIPLGPRTQSKGPQAVWNEDWEDRRVDVHSTAIDWAYPQRAILSPLGASSNAIENGNGRRPKVLQRYSSDPTQSRVRSTEDPYPLPTAEQVKLHITQYSEPPNFPRTSSLANRDPLFEGANSPQPEANEAESPPGPPGDRLKERVPTLTNSLENWGRDKFDGKDYVKTSDTLKGRHHITLKSGEHFNIHHGHRRQPIARNWSTSRKRFTAIIACLNTALVGILIGIYAGEVPAIQYSLADTRHLVIMGNVWLYIGMAITTFVFWPLPLLHGRKPYTLLALGLALPLQIPPAMIVAEKRSTVRDYTAYVAGMLICRGFLGVALGFAHINFKSTLLDLYGASLQSEFPHGEVVILDDVRRHGGGMGYWLGIWSFSFIGSIALGFLIGADIVSGLNLSWGFYISVIIIALMLFLNVVAPETRRSPHRRTMQEVELPNESVSRRVARGEIKMHVSGDGPKWWWEEVFAGIYLGLRMIIQSGFLVMALYLAWIYAEIVLIIVLLGNLLSAQYAWRPEFVGLGVLAIAVGALLAVPNSKANFFSRSRIQGPRTDSMTFQPRLTWTSHMVRRALFMTALPVAGLAYTLASKGRTVSYMIPIVFAGLIGYISNLAIAECNGIIMETFDTSDLQPGTNSKHRLQSLAPATRSRRTTYSSYPRVSAGLFVAQSLGFLFAAAATGVGGAVTRRVGAQKATAITAGILMGLTILLTCVLFRFRIVQIIPNELFTTSFGFTGGERKKSTASIDSDKSWRAVVIGSPSGKTRRMNWLELGSLSRWTEIRRLNRLLSRTTTQALNPGWR